MRPCECICACVCKSMCMSPSLPVYITKSVFIMISSSNARVAFNCNSSHVIWWNQHMHRHLIWIEKLLYILVHQIHICVCTVFQIHWPANPDRIQECIMAGKNLQVKHDFMYHSLFRQLFLKCLITNKLNHLNPHCMESLLVLSVLKLGRHHKQALFMCDSFLFM